MRLYEVTRFEGAQPGWSRTLTEAHKDAKLIPKDMRAEARIVLKDYPINHHTVTGLFNGVVPEGTPVRQWRLNARGALRELAFGEKPPIIE